MSKWFMLRVIESPRAPTSSASRTTRRIVSSQDTEAVEPIMRRCDQRGTFLTISGSELIVRKKPYRSG
jgi:hypothetical protein